MSTQISHNIIEKVQKLLSLSKSSNPHEAATAAALADKLVSKHQLTMAELQATSHEDVPVDRHPTPIYSSARRTAWKAHLATRLAKHYDCAVYISIGRTVGSLNKTSNYTLVGRAEDCEIAIFMFNWIEGEIERLAKKNASGMGHAYSQTYCEGAGDGVMEKLRAEKEKARSEAQEEGKGAALVLLDSKAIQAENKLAELCPNLKKGTGVSGARQKDASAYYSGHTAGKSMSIGKGISSKTTKFNKYLGV